MRAGRRWLRAGSVILIPALLAVDFAGCAHNVSVPEVTGDPGARRAVNRRLTAPMSPGKHVVLILRDSTRLEGTLQGVERYTPENYRAHAETVLAASTLEPPPPRPGTRLIVRPRRGKPYAARLLSYGLKSVEIERDDRRRVEFLPFDELVSVSAGDSLEWDRETLESEADEGRLPAFAQLAIVRGSMTYHVPAERVAIVSYVSSAGEAVDTVLVLGAIAGVLVLLVATLSPPDFSSGCTPIPGAYPL